MQKQEFEADALALERTGNVSAAVSALQKLTTQNTLPGFDQVDWGSTHPAVYKRIEKLRGHNAPPRAI
jgi:Zn-dependent protease with chaperone function